MAIFVDLDEESEPPQTVPIHGEWDGERAKLQLQQELLAGMKKAPNGLAINGLDGEPAAADQCMREDPNRNRMTEALRCYPIVIAIVSSLDLNTLDNLSRTCRQIREELLQYRGSLVTRTLHCFKEQPPLDPEDNEMNWYYMSINESYRRRGNCARDLVAECRRCARPVCRNCAIRPPGPSTFRDRHRRLCHSCTKAPLAALARPPLLPSTLIDADEMQRAICTCKSDRVWLCYPCGRNILGADQDYRSIWRWRNQYGEVLGGVGTGIGEGDRGVICGREAACLGAREIEQETDCDAADAREQLSLRHSSPESTPSPSSSFTTGSPLSTGSVGFSASGSEHDHRTPSPHSVGLVSGSGSGLRPGYARHEIEGIGGVVKIKLVRMMRVGACVPEWEDERKKGHILEREVSGGRRSWCGWCWRVIPGARDFQTHSSGL
ncbi:hypothetical protein HD806DRAFT_129872 [Xylariaceae sp. AK1471]|nr:hypothetical protein HD806DRAFT_129872 [Xylariaceae sp. AK1471]